MTYEVRLTRAARTEYERADRSLARKLARCFEQLERDPQSHPNARPLRHGLAGYWRYRVGDWRVIYRIEQSARVVYVIEIVHRGRAY